MWRRNNNPVCTEEVDQMIDRGTFSTKIFLFAVFAMASFTLLHISKVFV